MFSLVSQFTDFVVFDGALNVQLGGNFLKIHYTKITVMRGVEHNEFLFFNDASKILVVNQMVTAHKSV